MFSLQARTPRGRGAVGVSSQPHQALNRETHTGAGLDVIAIQPIPRITAHPGKINTLISIDYAFLTCHATRRRQLQPKSLPSKQDILQDMTPLSPSRDRPTTPITTPSPASPATPRRTAPRQKASSPSGDYPSCRTRPATSSSPPQPRSRCRPHHHRPLPCSHLCFQPGSPSCSPQIRSHSFLC